MITEYDVNNIDAILHDEKGYNWFTAKLLRLMAHSDSQNLEKLARVFPEEFLAFALWKWHGIPHQFTRVPAVYNLVETNPKYQWVNDVGNPIKIQVVNGRDF